MLPDTLPRSQVEKLIEDASVPGTQLTVNLVNSKVIRPNGNEFVFEIDAVKKRCLLNGLDKIGLTLEKEDKIVALETKRSKHFTWLDIASMKVPKTIAMYP